MASCRRRTARRRRSAPACRKARATSSALVAHGRAQRFLRGLRALGRQHLLLGAARAAALLPAGALDLLALGAGAAQPLLLDLVGQHSARDEAVLGLAALALAPDGHSRRAMAQEHAGGD